MQTRIETPTPGVPSWLARYAWWMNVAGRQSANAGIRDVVVGSVTPTTTTGDFV